MRIFGWVAAAVMVLGFGPAMAADFPVVVEHALGRTTVPAEPERVVAMTNRDADVLLALGVTPVAIQSQFGFESGVGPWAEERLGSAEPEIWLGMEINYEAVAAVDPDLIVFANSGMEEDVYERLSAIAPTIDLPLGASPWAATPQAMVQITAQALGRVGDGVAVNSELDAYLAAQKARYPQFAGKTLSYFDVFERTIFAYPADSIVTNILLSVGFEPSAAITALADDATHLDVSEERLLDFDADMLVVYAYGRSLEQLKSELPTFARLDAVREGRVVLIEDMALATNSPLSIPYALDRLLPRMAEALEAGG